MTTAMPGVKRSHNDMTGATPPYAESGRVSGLQSPTGTPSRGSSRPPDLQGVKKSKYSGLSPRVASFEPLASIVLIGIRGVGKSTLGILAATAYSRRLIDTERAFQEANGSTTSTYRKERGTAEYQKRHNQTFESTLNNNKNGAVIICTFSDLEGNGAKTLREYSQSHPVIHITRDLEGVKSVLRIWATERINDLLTTSGPLLRSCSNYEFFNLTDNGRGDDQPWSSLNGDQRGNENTNESFLTLKRVERDFLRLLRNIVGDNERGQAHHSAYPFSQIEVERREYTFAVTMSTSQVLEGSIDLDEAQIGADCVELLVDAELISKRRYFSDISRAFAIVRRATILPIMLSVDKTRAQNQNALFEAYSFCLRVGAELCTVDLSLADDQLADVVISKGYSKIVGHLDIANRAAQGWNDQACMEAYSRAARIGCDIVKITMPAATVDDCFHVQAFQNRVEVAGMKPNLIAYNTGPRGRTSKCFNRTLTSVQPPSSAYRENGPTTSITTRDVSQALFASFVFEPLRFYIFGADVSYSLSPAMHNAAYEACGMKYSYDAISSDTINVLKELSQTYDFGGSAITQPYKKAALGMVDGLSPHARAIDAINTIVPVRELLSDGSMPDEKDIISQQNQRSLVKALYGFNTDWIGIRACVRRGLSPANTIRPHTTALVCGAGGMGSAAIYSLISLGVRHIFLCNRTLSRAKALAKRYNELISSDELSELRSENSKHTRVQVLDSFTSNWPADARIPTIIVCCIPRRTAGNATTNFALQEEWLKSQTGGIVLEVAYRQPTSPLEQQVRARAQAGWIFMDGYDVLPEQAFSQFELFTGRRAPRKLMRDEIKRHVQS